MESKSVIEIIESNYCVHFVSLEEQGEDRLRLVVAANEGPDLYEFVWSQHFVYAARSEHFCQMDQTEKWSGDIYRVFTESKFLDFVGSATFANQDLPGHFGTTKFRASIGSLTWQPFSRQRCASWAAPNNSFKPKPLRGSA